MTKQAASKAAELVREAKTVLEKAGIVPGSPEHAVRAHLQNALDVLDPKED